VLTADRRRRNARSRWLSPIARPRSTLPVAQFLSHETPFWGYRTEQPSGTVPGGSRPGVHQELDPYGDGHSANTAAFAGRIGDHPAALALLNIIHGERGQLGPAQCFACRDSLIANTLRLARSFWRVTVSGTLGLRGRRMSHKSLAPIK
jgi:hypothetical protein